MKQIRKRTDRGAERGQPWKEKAPTWHVMSFKFFLISLSENPAWYPLSTICSAQATWCAHHLDQPAKSLPALPKESKNVLGSGWINTVHNCNCRSALHIIRHYLVLHRQALLMDLADTNTLSYKPGNRYVLTCTVCATRKWAICFQRR